MIQIEVNFETSRKFFLYKIVVTVLTNQLK